MAVLQVKKIQDDNSNELTVKILNKIPKKWIEPDSYGTTHYHTLGFNSGIMEDGIYKSLDIYKSLYLIYNIGRMGKNHMIVSMCAEDH